MTRDDLFDLLGLKPEDVESEDIVEMEVDEVELERTDTVFACDKWDYEQGERVLRKVLPASEDSHTRPFDPDAAADFYHVYWSVRPQQQDGVCHDQLRQQFLEALVQSPDYEELHESTKLNRSACDIAVEKLANEFAALQDFRDRHASTNTDPALDAFVAADRAAKQAQEEIDGLTATARALGHGQGEAGQPLNLDGVKQHFRRVRNNGQLRRIMELAGRYRRVAQSKQRQKTAHGYDDMIGIELSGEVSRLLPLEMAMLADEDFELDAMRRLVERQSMSRAYQGIEPQGKGPIVVVVDESGSMSGDPIAQAKAFALAMAWVAKHQNRYCLLVGFSGGTAGELCVLPPNRWNEEKLLDWLSHFYGGGTDMDVPLVELPTRYWAEAKVPRGKTDVVLITDAICHVPKHMEDLFNAWKLREKVRCIGLVIGASADSLKAVCDETYSVRGISETQDAVVRCLSV